MELRDYKFSMPYSPGIKKVGKTIKQLDEETCLYLLQQDEVIPSPEIALEMYEVTGIKTFGTMGNFSLITGKAKSRKSFFTVLLVASFLSPGYILGKIRSGLRDGKRKVVYFDTEQSKYHSQMAQKRILKLLAKDYCTDLQFYCLRTLNPTDRLELVEHIITTTIDLGFVVIDGIIDLTDGSMNDDRDSNDLPGRLMKWSEKQGIHISVVLHQNKSDTNARGHLGSFLTQKAETVVSISRNPQFKENSTVKAEYCRNREFEEFDFAIDEEGLPFLPSPETYQKINSVLKNEIKANDFSDLQHKMMLSEIFAKIEKPKYSELLYAVKSSYKDIKGKEISRDKAASFITDFKMKGWLKIQGTEGTRHCFYNLDLNS